jgi:glycosyltransferase involved in cell wall biosynthesis
VKRVLFLAYFFPPLGGGGCQRTLKLVRYLEPHGWRSTVVTTRDRDYWILDPTLLPEIPPSAEVLRAGGFTGGRLLHFLSRAGLLPIQESQGVRRRAPFRALRSLQGWIFFPDAYRGWSRAACREADARIQAGGIDALWTTSSPESAHMAGLALHEKHRIPWVADFRDPWVGRVTYRPPTKWHDAKHRAMERRVVRSADRVTLVSEAMVRLYRERYPEVDPSRFVFLPNGFDSDDWRRAASAAEESGGHRRAGEAKEHFVLLHAGQLAHRPTVRTLLASARRVLERDAKAREQLRLRFMGGNEEIGPRDRERYGLGATLEVLPSQPHLESLASMRSAQALALLGHGGSADALLYTGKLYEYLSSGRPVLAIVDDGPAADLIRSTRAGVVIRPGDEESAAGALREWLLAWRQGKDLSIHLSPRLLTTWERRELAYKASKILSDIVTETPRWKS